MCGFSGFLAADGVGTSAEESRARLQRMGDAISHRGPDGEGYWVESDSGIGLAHRRLAIIDLSPAGAQPMTSPSGRYVLVFNGEIYNHVGLRHMLARDSAAPAWRGHSDTETLLAGFEAWGVELTLQRVLGMFAFALWDRELRVLMLARDRLGEKPLYYGWQGRGSQAAFLFASELSALRRHPLFCGDINRAALALYMRHNCIGGSHSIYAGIHKLEPGHLLTITRLAPTPLVKAWWDGAQIPQKGLAEPFVGSSVEAVDALETLLRDAVSQQMVADVPLGAFLSGGVDSSAIVALMQQQSSRRVQTFSIGFHESEYNEAQHAKAVAQHFRTEHTELYVTPEHAMEVIPKLPRLYSEPFADSSQIPAYLVSELARRHVTVALSGDGGDELFCGYTRYEMTAKLWPWISRLPRSLRQYSARLITAVPPTYLDKLAGPLHLSRAGEKLHKGAELLGSGNVLEIYKRMVTNWHEPSSVVLTASEATTMLTEPGAALHGLGGVELMMALDMLGYLPDDILTKVDRASMGVSLETRVPFLDPRVVEFAWSLPLNYKLRDGMTKWPLRQMLYRHVPRELMERPKMGFAVPIDRWLRGPLRPWAESLLAEPRLRSEGFLNPGPIRQKWSEHLSGERNWQSQLWGVLMFQAWLEHQRG